MTRPSGARRRYRSRCRRDATTRDLGLLAHNLRQLQVTGDAVARGLHIIGVDPGRVTGLAHRTPSGGFDSLDVAGDEALPILEHLIHPLLEAGDDVGLVVERFTPTNQAHKHSRQPHAQRVQELVVDLARRWHVERLHVAPPSFAKRVGADETLRLLGMYTPADRDQHRNDAARLVVVGLLLWRPDELHRRLRSGRVDS